MTREFLLIVTISCEAPLEMFLPEWEDMPQHIRQMIHDDGPIPCEGSGSVGIYCDRCRFGAVGDSDVETKIDP